MSKQGDRIEELLREIADNGSKTNDLLSDIYNIADEAQKDAIRRDDERGSRR